MRARAENICLALAACLCAWSLARAAGRGPVSWGHYSVFLPVGLTVLALVNAFLRSKVMGWSLFTIALVLFMIIFGAAAVGYRGLSTVGFADFARAFLLYGAIGAAGLYQLRLRAPKLDR